MAKHPGSIDSLVLGHIRKMKPGNVFTPIDLARLGPRTAVASALSRHLRAGVIRQAGRGLYYVPRIHRLLGEIGPNPDAIATALTGKGHLRLQPSGAYATNLLGLSEQVPLKLVYLTDGTPRRVRTGRQEIILKRTTPKNMATAGRVSGLVIQAFRHLGRSRVDDQMLHALRRRLSAADKRTLLRDIRFAPAWVAEAMRQVAQPRKT